MSGKAANITEPSFTKVNLTGIRTDLKYPNRAGGSARQLQPATEGEFTGPPTGAMDDLLHRGTSSQEAERQMENILNRETRNRAFDAGASGRGGRGEYGPQDVPDVAGAKNVSSIADLGEAGLGDDLALGLVGALV
jgi:hypothetical protein